MLHVGQARRRRVRVRRPAPSTARSRARRGASRARRRGRADRAAGRSRPGRCGCGRRAACRRAGPPVRCSPRSSAVWTSSSSDGRAERPRLAGLVEIVERGEQLRPARRRRAARPGAAPGRARATPAGRRARAASRSARTSTARASASAGPPSKRPPHSRSGRGHSTVQLPAADGARSRRGGGLGRQPPELDEALGQRLVEGVPRVVGRQVVVVQRCRAAAAGHDRPAAVQAPSGCRRTRAPARSAMKASSARRSGENHRPS